MSRDWVCKISPAILNDVTWSAKIFEITKETLYKTFSCCQQCSCRQPSTYEKIAFHYEQWRHNGHDAVSNHQPHDCLPNHLFGRRSKKTSKLRVTGLCAGNSSVVSQSWSCGKSCYTPALNRKAESWNETSIWEIENREPIDKKRSSVALKRWSID